MQEVYLDITMLTRAHHGSPMMESCTVSLVISNANLYSTIVTAVLYTILCNTGVGYKGTSLYHQTSNISCTLIGNHIFDHLDIVGASPVSAAPTTSSFLT